jgi:5-oxoprolinase (ATP-hydrolysing)
VVSLGQPQYRAKDSLLSGPAGGVAGAAAAARRSGFERVVAFDMGGTSTDVARYGGDFGYVYEHRVGDALLLSPALDIHSVAAGGGSICSFDGDSLKVGPQSAGADPGPACYGLGGPLAITDANLLLGRLDPERFGIPIDPDASLNVAREVAAQLGKHSDPSSIRPVLAGFLDIANERMAEAIRGISVREGYDPADYVLVAFGGAGGQHACGVAERIGAATVLIPPDAGLLSARGLGAAVIERFAERQVLQPVDAVSSELGSIVRDLEDAARTAVAREGIAIDRVEIRRRLAQLRFVGQDSTIEIEVAGSADLAARFRERYAALFRHMPEGRTIELESVRIVASSRAAEQSSPSNAAPGTHHVAQPSRHREAWFAGRWQRVPFHDRTALQPGATVAGPAIVCEAHGTTVVEVGWTLSVDDAGALVMTRSAAAEVADDEGPEESRIELFTSRFESIAKEMGEMLRRTALSTNIKERLDFSCALLNPDGELVVNAPHIPVHLGALGLCVRSVVSELDLRPGDIVITNHPAHGGSHLPDVTIISPVHAPDGPHLGYVASRAHHAEIGGARPGSMPPDATTLLEEGVVIPPMHLCRAGVADWEAIEDLLAGATWPSRTVSDNVADLRAAVAANLRGANALQRLAASYDVETILHYMNALTGKAERAMRRVLAAMPDGIYEAEEHLDDGCPIRVRVVIEGDTACIDFAGTGPTHPRNLNATPAITRSAVLYVLRLLIDEPLPLNEGIMRPIDVRIPRCLLNPEFDPDPARCPAVVGGNVETSQRIVDTLIKAFGIQACSQGTMNNLLFGTDQFGYYETICGGAGAGPTFNGASGVHTHMTNTRITDVEVIEHRYPVRIERFGLRTGSGGDGTHRGGDGVVREIEFLAPMAVSVLTQHRIQRPFGLDGGSPGQAGRQYIQRADGTRQTLSSIDGADASPVRAHPTSPATATTLSRRLGRRMARHVHRPSWMLLARHELTARHPPKRGAVGRSETFASPSKIDAHVDGNPNHMASTRNRIGHFGRAISGRNEPKRRETAQNAPKPPESGPPPCPVWEMNSDPSHATYVRSCAHPRRPRNRPSPRPCAPARTGRSNIIGESNQRPNKCLARRRGPGTLEVLISPPRDHRKGFSWVPSPCCVCARPASPSRSRWRRSAFSMRPGDRSLFHRPFGKNALSIRWWICSTMRIRLSSHIRAGGFSRSLRVTSPPGDPRIFTNRKSCVSSPWIVCCNGSASSMSWSVPKYRM